MYVVYTPGISAPRHSGAEAGTGPSATPSSVHLRSGWRRRARPVRIAGITVAALAVAGLSGATAANASITASTGHLAHDDAASVPARPVALVFGVLVEADGTPSPRLVDRLRGAAELHRAGRVRRLVMTGDGQPPGYDETVAMRDWALAAGVPADAIERDTGGLDTYDSCWRARHVYSIDAAVLVTQAYHLPRALYLCRALGIDAVGLAVPDWRHRPEQAVTRYGWDQQARHNVREWFARANATVDARRVRAPAVTGPR
jgi:vancomycin permeability regulator SanA